MMTIGVDQGTADSVRQKPDRRNPKAPTKAVLCPKCEHLNSRDRTACARCGASLWQTCHACEGKFEATLSRCTNCGKRTKRNKRRGTNKTVKAPLTTNEKANLFLIILATVVFITVFITLNMGD